MLVIYYSNVFFKQIFLPNRRGLSYQKHILFIYHVVRAIILWDNHFAAMILDYKESWFTQDTNKKGIFGRSHGVFMLLFTLQSAFWFRFRFFWRLLKCKIHITLWYNIRINMYSPSKCFTGKGQKNYIFSQS